MTWKKMALIVAAIAFVGAMCGIGGGLFTVPLLHFGVRLPLKQAVATALVLVSGNDLFAGLAAVFLLVLGFALCVPLLVRVAAKLAAPFADTVGGTPARMAVAGIASGLSRTGIAIVDDPHRQCMCTNRRR